MKASKKLMFSFSGFQMNQIHVNFHLQKCLEFLIKNQQTKLDPKKHKEKKYPPSCQLVLSLFPSQLLSLHNTNDCSKYTLFLSARIASASSSISPFFLPSFRANLNLNFNTYIINNCVNSYLIGY